MTATESKAPVLEPWCHAWRHGFAPQFSTAGLTALRDALAGDLGALMQGKTTEPPPMVFTEGWPCEGACAVGYVGWKGSDLETVGEVEKFFAHAAFQADKLLGHGAACRHFLNWFDENPRPVVRAALLVEVERELSLRASADATPDTPTTVNAA